MASGFRSERQAIATVVDAFAAATGVPIFWPDTQKKPPAPSADPSTPAAYLVVDTEYARNELVTNAMQRQVDGSVVIHIWVERNAGDDLVRGYMDDLEDRFLHGDDLALPIYFEALKAPGPPLIGGEAGEWYGRRIDVPFTRFT